MRVNSSFYNKIIAALLAISMVAIVVLGYTFIDEKKTGSGVTIESTTTGSLVDNSTTDKEETTEDVTTSTTDSTNNSMTEGDIIKIMAVGDNLIHPGIYKTGDRNEGKMNDGKYNFDFLFDDIMEYLNACDVKIINQETIFAGADKGLCGYPRFNSPVEIADEIAEVGFNVVLHASNHTRDMGMDGVQYSVDYWKRYPSVLVTGINDTEDDYYKIPIIEVRGVKIAVINYTYNLNSTRGLGVKEYYKINILGKTDESSRQVSYTEINPKVLEDIKVAEEVADFTIVCPHWGTEYTHTPTKTEYKWGLQMVEAGADLIIGTHPHVIQPIEWVEAENGNKGLVYYSLGNFTSTQPYSYTMLGGLALINLQVKDGKVSVMTEGTGVVPVVNHYTATNFANITVHSAMKLSDYTEELASKHGVMNWARLNDIAYDRKDFTKAHLDSIAKKVFGDWIIE